MTMKQVNRILEDIGAEVGRAASKHAPMNSAHEAYAVILEEVDELWDEVKKKRSERSDEKMRDEALQIAAMCVRMIVDVID